jgi:hypothetical protein
VAGPSSQPADCLLDEALTKPVGATWRETSHGAVTGWSRPSASGPWTFDGLPEALTTQTRTVVGASEAPWFDTFPTANYVVRTDVAGVATASIFRFYESRPDALYWLGDSDELLAVTVDPPQKFQPASLRVGQRWEQSYRDSRFDVEVVSDHEVIGCGVVTVPAGQFARALLLRSTYQYAGSPATSTVHTWHAPEVGMVASTIVTSGGDDGAMVIVLTSYQPGR